MGQRDVLLWQNDALKYRKTAPQLADNLRYSIPGQSKDQGGLSL